LTLSDANNCTINDTFSIACLPLIPVVAPQFLSPNGDNQNDLWILQNTAQYPELEVKVYNRWGGLVFESNNFNVGWDGISNGVICPEGVYVYVVTFKNARGLEKKLHGTLTLIR
jgi:gliding motility-associated-like protein